MMAAPAYKEYRVFRYMEAAFMLEDMNVRYEEATVVRYSSMDYQLPLLASNARYRCGLDQGQGQGHGHDLGSGQGLDISEPCLLSYP